jgi:DNA-binding CsgD family transcriptional regulator
MLHDDAHLVALLGDNSSSASLTPPSALEALVVEMNGQERLLFVYPRPDWALPASLSPAEGCIVRGLLSGASHSEIARARGTSPRTVANQMASIFRKLHVGSRLELFVLLRRGVGAESPIMGH